MKIIYSTLAALVGLLTVIGAASAAEELPHLSGKVKARGGSPLAGATIVIYTSTPKQGASSVAPSSYPDCSKKCVTDGEGKYRIDKLDPKLKFKVLVMATGYECEVLNDVDPSKGPKIVSLAPITPEAMNSPLRIKGVVLGDDGTPIPYALLDPSRVTWGPSSQWGRPDKFIEPMVVADENGRFAFHCKSNTLTEVFVLMEGKNAAKQRRSFKAGGDYLVHLSAGALIKGRIVRDGKPLANVEVAMSTKERNSDVHMAGFETVTDSQGRFTLVNLPPGIEFSFFSKMNSLRERGCLAPKFFLTADSGVTQDLGDLSVVPAFKVSGRVTLSDGQKIPAGHKISLGRESAWDYTETEVAPDGHFEFPGVPAESVSINFRLNGYKFAHANGSLDYYNGGIVGVVSADTKEINLLMEPGKWGYNGSEGQPPDGGPMQPSNLPLRGVSQKQ